MLRRDHRFSRTAASLAGSIAKVVILYSLFYWKTLRNMRVAADQNVFICTDSADARKDELTRKIAGVAASYRIRLTVCGQPEHGSVTWEEARCVTAERLSDVAGCPVNARLNGNRQGCACFEAFSVGDYNNCSHSCIYCYAVQNRAFAIRHHSLHDSVSTSIYTLNRAIDTRPLSMKSLPSSQRRQSESN